jgi:hypothetical protein
MLSTSRESDWATKVVLQSFYTVEDKTKPERISIGGDVADFLGTLRERDSSERYENSQNPYGNPFEGKSVMEMVDLFSSRNQGIHNLEILRDRLDDFYGVNEKKSESEKPPATYFEAKTLVNKMIQHTKQQLDRIIKK